MKTCCVFSLFVVEDGRLFFASVVLRWFCSSVLSVVVVAKHVLRSGTVSFYTSFVGCIFSVRTFVGCYLSILWAWWCFTSAAFCRREFVFCDKVVRALYFVDPWRYQCAFWLQSTHVWVEHAFLLTNCVLFVFNTSDVLQFEISCAKFIVLVEETVQFGDMFEKGCGVAATWFRICIVPIPGVNNGRFRAFRELTLQLYYMRMKAAIVNTWNGHNANSEPGGLQWITSRDKRTTWPPGWWRRCELQSQCVLESKLHLLLTKVM